MDSQADFFVCTVESRVIREPILNRIGGKLLQLANNEREDDGYKNCLNEVSAKLIKIPSHNFEFRRLLLDPRVSVSLIILSASRRFLPHAPSVFRRRNL